MSIRTWFANLLMPLFPPSHGFKMRVAFWNWSGCKISPTARLVSTVKILGPLVEVGDDTFIGHEVMLTGAVDSKISIGNNCDIAPRTILITGSHEIDPVGAHSAGKGVSQGICIQDGVWIGAGCIILGGVTIGRKAVIGAGSIVTRNIPPYMIAMGSPCKAVRRIDKQNV